VTETGPAAEPDKGVYRSYLLRLWQGGAQAPWRASIQEVSTGEITHFASIEALLAFIASETGTVLTGITGDEEEEG